MCVDHVDMSMGCMWGTCVWVAWGWGGRTAREAEDVDVGEGGDRVRVVLVDEEAHLPPMMRGVG
eukprot:1651141-Prymnesium_polylepis.2